MTLIRSYRVKHHIDHHPDSCLHWRLYTYGHGNWCIGQGHSGSFSSEHKAHTAGLEWVWSGLPPCEQKRIMTEGVAT